MSLTIHSLSPKRGSRTKSFRIGRGPGSGRGKTAGRGTKGQRARTGGRNKLKMKGMKQMLLGFPKMRGFTSHYEKAKTVTLGQLERLDAAKPVTLAELKRVGLAARSTQSVKIVLGGTLTKPLQLKGMRASAAAKKSIVAVGGSLSSIAH